MRPGDQNPKPQAHALHDPDSRTQSASNATAEETLMEVERP